MIDRNPDMMEAIKRAHTGDEEYYNKIQDAFLERVAKSGEDHCTCKKACMFHGDCQSCVTIHRAHADHLPACFRDMVNDRIRAISGLTEHSFKKSE
jgi:hypothetical protein